MLNVEEISDSKDFLKLAPIWNRVLSESNSDNIFLTWEWVSNWWKVYGEGKNLRVLILRDEAGALMAIAPLYLQKKTVMGGVAVNEIRFIGSGEDVSPDYLDLIIRKGLEREALSAFIDHLEVSDEWDVLNLTDILSTSESVSLLEEAARERGLNVESKECAICPYITLPSSWEGYLEGLSANTRYNVRRRMRNIEKIFKTTYLLWEDQDRLDEAMDRLAELHNSRWKEKGTIRSFSTTRYNTFHKAIAKNFARAGWLSLSCLDLDGVIVGMLYDYRYGKKMYYYQGGFDPSFYKYSLGLVLRAYVIRGAIEEGIEEVDLLKGAYDFKYIWTDHNRSTVNLVVGKDNVRAKAFFFNMFQKPRVKASIKRAVPDALLKLFKR